METTTSSPKQGTGKDVYTIITERIMEQLEKGTVPWQHPWHKAGIPRSLISGKPYRGINIILLASLGYEQNYFLTYKQLQEIGGKVKKDEKGQIITYWSVSEKEAESAEGIGEEQESKKTFVLKYYNVFNIAQCENIPADKLPPLETRDTSLIPDCESIVANMPDAPLIKHKEHKAYYNPLQDFVNMPRQKSFKTDDAYYSTLFHELIHSTGHHSRLERPTLIEMSEFGSDTYSLEELTAEIGTCYLQSLTGTESQFENSAGYIQGWLAKLKNDRRFIYTAAGAAQKAVDYMLNVQIETDESKEE